MNGPVTGRVSGDHDGELEGGSTVRQCEVKNLFFLCFLTFSMNSFGPDLVFTLELSRQKTFTATTYLFKKKYFSCFLKVT